MRNCTRGGAAWYGNEIRRYRWRISGMAMNDPAREDCHFAPAAFDIAPLRARYEDTTSRVRGRGGDEVPHRVQPSDSEGLLQSRVQVAPPKLSGLARPGPCSRAPVR